MLPFRLRAYLLKEKHRVLYIALGALMLVCVLFGSAMSPFQMEKIFHQLEEMLLTAH